jgi:hypothetical protein
MRKTLGSFVVWVVLASVAGAVSAQDGVPAGEGSRNFVLQYLINDYNKEYEKTLDYFVDSVLSVGDQFILITPMKLYGYSKDKWSALSKQALKNDLRGRLRNDAAVAGAEFQNVYAAMEELISDLASASGENELLNILTRYRSLRANLTTLFKFNAPIYLKIADFLKSQTGSKIMIVFLGQTFVPTGDKDTIDSLPDSEAKRSMVELFRFPPNQDVDISGSMSALSDAKIRMNLIYGNIKTPLRRGMEYLETSMDFYQAYKKIAQTTGGTAGATFEPVQPLMKIAGLLSRPEKTN